MHNKELINKMLMGDVYSLAKIISLVESNSKHTGEIMQSIFPFCNGANTIGITGSPGAGKSSVIYHLAKKMSDKGKRTAVLAIDPNSHLTGGALLGDRIRMDDLEDVYIRSIGNKCQAGGISSAAYFIIKILEACKYEYIFIETVGAGQSEVKIKDLADFTMLTLAPGLGDDIQANKAGIMEIGDALIVNKSDKPDAIRLEIQLKDMLNTSQLQDEHTEVFLTDSINGVGFDELADFILKKTKDAPSKDTQIDKLKNQYIELTQHKLNEIIKNNIKSNKNIDEILSEVLSGKKNITQLIDDNIKDMLMSKYN